MTIDPVTLRPTLFLRAARNTEEFRHLRHLHDTTEPIELFGVKWLVERMDSSFDGGYSFSLSLWKQSS